MSGIARGRLSAERKAWRKDRPVGMYARPGKNADGSNNLMKWDCGIPGKEGTMWEGGIFKLVLQFTEDYPSKPPAVVFTPPLFHPNVYSNGRVCLDIINEGQGWVPAVTVKQVLVGVQDLLDTPNTNDPANGPANTMFKTNRSQYNAKIQALISVDSLQLSALDFMKVDVEGMELQVLRGANATIARFKPVLYVENDRFDTRVVDLLAALQYRCFFHTPPIFNPQNWRAERKNVFEGQVSINLLCQHTQVAEAEVTQAQLVDGMPASYRPPQRLALRTGMSAGSQQLLQLRTAVATRPYDAMALEALAQLLMRRDAEGTAPAGTTEKALRLLQAAIAISTSQQQGAGSELSSGRASSDAYHNAGVLLHSKGRTEEAIGFYMGALSLAPERTETLNNHAAALKRGGRLPEAVGAYERAIAIQPSYGKAHYNLAIAFEAQAARAAEAQAAQELHAAASRAYNLAAQLDPVLRRAAGGRSGGGG
eukprot:g1780.t1